MEIPAEPASTPSLASYGANERNTEMQTSDERSIDAGKDDSCTLGQPDSCDSDRESLASLKSFKAMLEYVTSRPVSTTEGASDPDHPLADAEDKTDPENEHNSIGSSDSEVYEGRYRAEISPKACGRFHDLCQIQIINMRRLT